MLFTSTFTLSPSTLRASMPSVFSARFNLCLLWLLVVCASTNAGLAGSVTNGPQLTVFMVGDSTMADKPLIPANPERGWGQLLPMYFKSEVRIANHAMNGRSTKSFIAEGRWKTVREQLQPGNYVIIQFGHNDEHKQNLAQFTEAFGEFKTNLELYVRETRECKALPILATPVARRKFDTNGVLRDTHGDYVVAVRQVAAEQHVPLLDLEKRSFELVSKMGPEQSKRLYDWIQPNEFAARPDGLTDDTHFCAYGASRICDLAVGEMQTATPELAKWLRN
jgi:lysophospholipase L1-like esterase